MGKHGNRGNTRPLLHRKTGPNYNPRGWTTGAPFPLVHVNVETTTAFEDFVAELGVPEQFWSETREIRRWVHAHKNTMYVPEWLLEALGERVMWEGYEL